MGRYTGPKNRIARRIGANIFGRRRNPLLHKSHGPGMHGAKRKKQSDFGIQLGEKQKLKAVYGMLREKQLVRYYKLAARRKGSTVCSLLQSLECRLDNIIYRLKLAPTIFAAQQLVSHGHVNVNEKKIDCRSFSVTPGMTVSIKEKSQKIALIRNSLEDNTRSVPEYLALNPNTFSGTLIAIPDIDQITLPVIINMPLVCDFLAHTT